MLRRISSKSGSGALEAPPPTSLHQNVPDRIGPGIRSSRNGRLFADGRIARIGHGSCVRARRGTAHRHQVLHREALTRPCSRYVYGSSHHDIPCRTCRFFRVRRPDRGGVDPEPSIGEPPPCSGKSAITRDQFEARCIRLCLASHLTRPSHGFPKDKCRMPRAYRTARVQEKAHAAVPAD